MSLQHLNLFDPALKPKREWLSLANVVLATVFVLMLLVVVGAWGKHKEDLELTRLKSQESQLKATQAQLVELATMQANRRTDPALEKEIVDKRLLLAQKQQILELLNGGELGQPEGFAAMMEALARQVPEGLWLQGFDLQAGGRTLVLRGALVSEPLLPRFVQALNQEPLFKGRHFSALQVSPVAPVAPSTEGEDGRTYLERVGYLQFSLEGLDAGKSMNAGGRE